MEQQGVETEDPFPRIVEHIVGANFASVSASAVAACKVFLLDTFGVGAAGAKGASLDGVESVARLWGAGDDAAIWGTGERLPAASAAFVNGYRIHSLEFDCLHERAVLHPMATILSAIMAFADRSSRQGRPISGKALMSATVVGVDVATFLGFAARGPLRFFRPATAGGFGACAGIANCAGLDREKTANALGIQYSQTAGTMQAHVEGSICLALQVGFAARSAVTSVDLAVAGLTGPHDIFTGRHGYFRLFEDNRFQIDGEIDRIGRDHQVEELAHKPFPSGRLTHGSVDALMRFSSKLTFRPDDIELFECFVPPVVARQVGRPDLPSPEPNYAKLCIPFVAATWLRRGRVDVSGFLGKQVLEDRLTHEYAARVRVIEDDNPDPNAMTPQRFRLTLKDGSVHELRLDHVLGHPQVPLGRDGNIEKFHAACGQGGVPVERAEKLIAAVDRLEEINDVATLIPLLRSAAHA